jgi:multiple sugar transport system substrate-binding protein
MRSFPGSKARLAMTALGAGALALSLTGTSLAAPQKAAAGKVTITFMEAMSSGTLKTAMQYLTAEFNKTHSGIDVQLIVEPSYGVLETKEEAAIAAGAPPTIGQVYEEWAAEFANSKAIVPLTSYLNGPNGLTAAQKADIWPDIYKDQFLPDGKIWMWPFNKSDYVLYYNEAWLKKAGLPVPTTWTQFAKDAKAVTTSSTWAIAIDPGTPAAPADGTFLFFALDLADGGQIVKGGEPNLDSPQAVWALNYLLTLEKEGALKLGTNYPGQTDLGAQKEPFDWSTIAGYYYEQAAAGGKFTVGVAAAPSGSHGQGNILEGTNISIFAKATTAQKNAGWAFMKWLAEPQQTAYWAVHTGYLPVDKSAITLMKSYYDTHPYQRIAAESLAESYNMPAQAAMQNALGDVSTAMQEVLEGHSTVAQALAQAESTAKQAFASGQ